MITEAIAAKERPILFSGPMVKAILDGRKTQTRRVINPQPGDAFPMKNQDETLRGDFFLSDRVHTRVGKSGCYSPYGKPGDRLWVREAWRTGGKLDSFNAKQIASRCIDAGFSKVGAPIWYAIDNFFRPWGTRDVDDFGLPGRLRHSRFMPRWASRTLLQITEVRVERLNAISVADAVAEGMQTVPEYENGKRVEDSVFRIRWDQLNGKPRPYKTKVGKANATRFADFSWEKNPWVWVIEFKRMAVAA